MPDLRAPSRICGSVQVDVDGQRQVLSPRCFASLGLEQTGAPVWDLSHWEQTIDDNAAPLEAEHQAPEGTVHPEMLAFSGAQVLAGSVHCLWTPPRL